MKKKRFAATGLIVAMLAAAIGGCGSSQSETTAAATTAAVTESAQEETDAAPAETAAETDSVIETDVVVVGGGGAGISAAIAAAQQGKNVVLLEKMGYLGGATMISGGLIPAVGTKQQVEAGIEDDFDWFVRDMMRPNNYSVRQELVYTVADQAKPTIEWLEDLGVNFSVVTGSLYYGQSNYRMHLAEGSGQGLTNKMVEALESNGNITVMLQTPGTGLAVNDAGEVTGVYAENSEGTMLIQAENTVLATSGFAANKEMLAQYMPEVYDAYPLVAPGATGEGILWGQELGAAVANMGAYQGHAFYSEAFGGSVDQGIANRGGIFVNTNGVRFTNEYNGYSELTPHVLAQPGHHAYLIFDDANAQNTAKFEAFQEKGIVYTADTAEELAELIEVDAEKLAATISAYQASIERGEDEFNRTKLPESFKAPYHAILITGDLRHTQGGLVTDVAAHVLTEDGQVIPGLCAAGGVTEGFSSKGGAAYMSGNGLLQAIIFGKIAGEKAATEARGSAVVEVWENSNPETVAATVVETAAAEAAEEPAADVVYQDGVYEGEGEGFHGPVTVSVTVADGKVTEIEVLSQSETEGIYQSAEGPVLQGIIENNGIAGVDTVAGATGSSNGLLGAVKDALAKAQ